jgi:hypothetical protein
MNRLCGIARKSILVAAAVVATLGHAHAAVSCHKINAKGVGQDLGGGVTEARIVGGGLLHGTTQGNFIITGGAPPVFVIGGTVTFTTRQATLTVSLTGTFDVATGAFVTTGPVMSSTGKLAGATGTLTLDGVQDLASGRFTEEVNGLICVDLGK